MVAICNKCSAKVQRGGKNAQSFNTTNLIFHLKSRHSKDDAWMEYATLHNINVGKKIEFWCGSAYPTGI